jgi:hypothetical protein
VMVHATNRANAMSRSSKVRTRTAAVYRGTGSHPKLPGAIGSQHFGPPTHRRPSRRKYRVRRDLRVIVRMGAQADHPLVTAPRATATRPQDSKA